MSILLSRKTTESEMLKKPCFWNSLPYNVLFWIREVRYVRWYNCIKLAPREVIAINPNCSTIRPHVGPTCLLKRVGELETTIWKCSELIQLVCHAKELRKVILDILQIRAKSQSGSRKSYYKFNYLVLIIYTALSLQHKIIRIFAHFDGRGGETVFIVCTWYG